MHEPIDLLLKLGEDFARYTPFSREEASCILQLSPKHYDALVAQSVLRSSIVIFDDPFQRFRFHSFWDLVECSICLCTGWPFIAYKSLFDSISYFCDDLNAILFEKDGMIHPNNVFEQIGKLEPFSIVETRSIRIAPKDMGANLDVIPILPVCALNILNNIMSRVMTIVEKHDERCNYQRNLFETQLEMSFDFAPYDLAKSIFRNGRSLPESVPINVLECGLAA